MPVFIYEFKFTKDEHIDLNSLSDEALKRINEKKYDSEFHQLGISNIVKIGIVFRSKNAVVRK